MPFSEIFLKSQLNFLKPFVKGSSLDFVRKGQRRIGEIMASKNLRDVVISFESYENYDAAWVIPKDEIRSGVILYLHGGGYTCGGIDYAKGFGSVLAAETGTRVFCVAYRLAPENPFPAALEDASDAYHRVISHGYDPKSIVLCGESAGGGLAYSLCLDLKSRNEKLPAGIIAISPWTDLTASGESYKLNADKDPSITVEQLKFFADCYSKEQENPLVSPLFGELSDFPPSLIFVGGDEIMLDDSQLLHKKLISAGSKSTLIIADGLWHAYVLYKLKSRRCDIDRLNLFLTEVLHGQKKLRWMKLDNAAKIYPAARRRTWTNMYRVASTLKEKIDPEILQSALDVTVRRFPSISVRIRQGVFWYYLEEIPKAPSVEIENSYPLTHFPFSSIRKCAFRVFYYENRIAVELFHALTDGNGALVFLKSLTAEYITQKYGVDIPNENGVLSRLENPSESELEDSFPKYSGNVAKSRREENAYRLRGTPELDGFLHITTFMTDVSELKRKSSEYGVTVNTFLVSALIQSILNLQEKNEVPRSRRKHVKICVPVNLRKFFPSNTLRNFAMYVNPGVDARLGKYDFREICNLVHHQIGYMVTTKEMETRITPNIAAEQNVFVKIMPLFIKNIVMKLIYDAVGEKKSCICASNLGAVKLPTDMEKYVERLDFILGVQATYPWNCGIVSYKDTMYINFIRSVKESDLELAFYEVLRELGINIKVESNER